MKLIKVVFLSYAILCFSMQSGILAEDKLIQKGDTFPEVRLPAPDNPSQLKELGLTETDTFRIRDIKADIVVIQIFHTG